MPFGVFRDFKDCENKAPEHVHDTGAYCGAIKRDTEDKSMDKAEDAVAASACPECGKDVKPGNKYCSWECGSGAKKFKMVLDYIVKCEIGRAHV